MKKVVLYLLAALVVAAGGVVVLAPSLFDRDRYGKELTERLEHALARSVTLEDGFSLRLLPRPTLGLHGIRLGPGEDTALLSVAAVDAVLDPWALLRGELVVGELRLQRPVFALAALRDGAAAWAQRRTATMIEGASIERIAIAEGSIVTPADGAAIISDITADIEAPRPGMPYQAKGEAVWRGVPLGFDGVVGIDSGQGIPARLSLKLAEGKAEARLTGQVHTDQEVPRFAGKLTLSGDDARAVTERLTGFTLPAPAAAALGLQGALTAGESGLRLTQTELRIGDTRATGGMEIDFGAAPRGQVTLSFVSLDLDPWIAGWAPKQGAPLPGALPVSFDVTADALVWRGAIVRQARLDAVARDGAVQVNQASALLPGGSWAIATGSIDLRDGAPRLDGRFEASSDNLRVALDWLKVPATGVPADRLRVFQASGKLRGTPRELQLSELDARLDTTQLRGAVTLRLGARLGIGANLLAETVNLDAYRPAGGDWSAVLRTLGLFDANVKARFAQLTVADLTARDVALEAALVNGTLTLQQARAGDIAGTAALLTGGITGLGGDAPALRDLRYDLRGDDAARLARLFGVSLPVPAERLGRVTATGTLNGDRRLLSFDSRTATAAGTISATGSVADPHGQPRWSASLSLEHGALAESLRLWLPDYHPAGSPGGLRLSGRIDGHAEELAVSELRGTVGPVAIEGLAHLSLGERPKISASLRAGPIDTAPFLPAKRTAGLLPIGAGLSAGGWSREPLGLDGLRALDLDLAVEAAALTHDGQRLDAPRLQVALHDGVARLERFLGRLGDGELAASGSLTADGVVSLRAELAAARPQPFGLAGVALAGAVVDGSLTLSSEGRSLFEMVNRLRGDARLAARDGALRGFRLAELSGRLGSLNDPAAVPALVATAMAGGQTSLARLSGSFTISDGIVGSEDLSAEVEGGTVVAIATAGLPLETVDARVSLRLTDLPQAPGFVMSLAGPLDRPARVFDTDALRDWVARRVAEKMKAAEAAALSSILPVPVETEPLPAPPDAVAPPPDPVVGLP